MKKIDMSELEPDVRDYILGLREEAAGYRVERNTVSAQLTETQVHLKDAEDKAAELESKVTELESKVSEVSESVTQRDRESWRKEAADLHKVPAHLVDRLQGSTREEILADAAEVAKGLPAGNPTPPVDESLKNDGNTGADKVAPGLPRLTAAYRNSSGE